MRAARTDFARRFTAPTIAAAAFVVAVLVVVIGSAQAAPSTKLYSATVHLTDAETSSTAFTLTLANDAKSRQSIGSANFTAPPNFTVPSASQTVTSGDGNEWTVTSSGSSVVEFRAASNDDALAPGESVSASVSVTVPSSCGSATWTTQAKQSNDFSGQPGNDARLETLASDLTPLGSFSIATIETVEDGQQIPAIYTDKPFTSTTTALDTCGATKTNYSGATLTRTLLTDATFSPTSGLSWSNGVGTVTFTPTWTETGNSLTVTDTTTGVSETSNSFDVSDTLCTPADTEPCHWQDRPGNPRVLADAAAPPAHANLGIGFSPSSVLTYLDFSCDAVTAPVGGLLVNINPRGYTVPFTVALTYKKSVSGSGPASSFTLCLSKDDGDTWLSVGDCGSTPDPPCLQTRKRTSGGDLLLVVYLVQGDPWGGLG